MYMEVCGNGYSQNIVTTSLFMTLLSRQRNITHKSPFWVKTLAYKIRFKKRRYAFDFLISRTSFASNKFITLYV